MIILSGNSNRPLAQKIVEHLDRPLGHMDIKRFRDSELYAEVKDTIRGKDVFIIQSTSQPANDYLMELLIIIDALKRGSAKRVSAVIPYFGYARQDRKTSSRSPITAKLVANLLTQAGADRIVSLDLHTLQIQGFFDIPVDHLMANVLFAKHIQDNYDLKDTVIVSPDIGGVGRARQMAKYLGCDIAIIDKRRPKPGQSEVMNIIGSVEGRKCILIDDIADSTGTLCNAAEALITIGKAKQTFAYCTHGVFAGDAYKRLTSSQYLEKIICTDSIDISAEKYNQLGGKVEIITCSRLLATTISRIHNEESTSDLFLK